MTYCFSCSNGHKWEVTRRLSEKKLPGESSCPNCGSVAERDFHAELTAPTPPGCYADEGHLWSDACGVSSDKIDAERKRFPHHVFRRTEEGTYQRGFRNANHRRSCLKELGLVDKQSYI